MVGPIAYIGGKNRLASTIIRLLPRHVAYVEPFAGGAQVLFHKDATLSKVEVLNDLDGEIINFFRCCQQHYPELVRYLKYCLMSRKWYELMTATDPALQTDIQRAARLFYIQKNSYGGLIVKANYHYTVTHPPNYNVKRIPEIIERTHERLRRVQLECLPYQEILKRYDRPTTCFYLDPPYYGKELYKHNLGPTEFLELKGLLSVLRGKFVLSINDLPEVRSLFAEFHVKAVDLAYSGQRKVGQRYTELLVANYPLAGPMLPTPLPREATAESG